MGIELFSQKFTFHIGFIIQQFPISYTIEKVNIFMMVPVCSCNYKSSDSTCTHHKQHDTLGPKVQYNTNTKLYFLFAASASPSLRWGVGSWQAHQEFFYLLFYGKLWH